MKLGFREKFGFGLGDGACNFIWGTMGTFLLYFYTDIFGIAAGAVGALFLFARVLDAFADFGMGAIADRTQTRWGKFRPYLLWMCAPLAVVFVLTFTTPDVGTTGKIIWAWVTYNLLMIFYTTVNIPYGALSGVMTDDPLDRTSLNAYRMGLAQVGGLVVNASTLPLIAWFGRHGQAGQVDQAHGYQMTVMVFACALVVLFPLTFLATRERIKPPQAHNERFRDDLKRLVENRHWVVMFLTGMIGLTFVIIRSGAMIYYCKYDLGFAKQTVDLLGFHADKTSFFLVLGNVVFIVGTTFTRHLVRLIGKKYSYVVTELAMAAACAAFYWAPVDRPDLIFALQVGSSFIIGLNATLYWAMVADTADFSEWKYRTRSTGVMYSGISFSHKVGLGVGGAFSGWLLSHYGYVANAVQSAQSGQGILLMVSLIPAAGFALVAVVFLFYGLNEKFCHEIREELAQRRALAA